MGKNTQPTSESYPVSVFQTMYTPDVKVPFYGGSSQSYFNESFKIKSGDDSIETWANHNDCHSNSIEPYWQGEMKRYECPDTMVILDAYTQYNYYRYYMVYYFIHDVDHLPPRVEEFSDCCSDKMFELTADGKTLTCEDLEYDTSKCGWTNTFNETGDMRCPLECSPICIEENAFTTNTLQCD